MTNQPPALPPAEQAVLEWTIPINRSPWAVAAGYVAIFSIPFLFIAPFAVVLGVVALVDLKKNPTKKGKGRAIFAIIYGGIVTVIFAYLMAQGAGLFR